MTEDDVTLMLAFKKGDYNAFSVLVERYQKPLIQFFYSYFRDREKAEDATQEIWRKVFRARADYEPRAKFKTWLFRVARNHWIDSYRSSAARGTEFSLDRSAPGSEEGTPGMGRTLADDGLSPVEAVMDLELKERIEIALGRLPGGHRDVFVLAEFQGMKYAEIAEVLEIPVGTVKSRMFNAVRRLRAMLEGVG